MSGVPLTCITICLVEAGNREASGKYTSAFKHLLTISCPHYISLNEVSKDWLYNVVLSPISKSMAGAFLILACKMLLGKGLAPPEGKEGLLWLGKQLAEAVSLPALGEQHSWLDFCSSF